MGQAATTCSCAPCGSSSEEAGFELRSTPHLTTDERSAGNGGDPCDVRKLDNNLKALESSKDQPTDYFDQQADRAARSHREQGSGPGSYSFSYFDKEMPELQQMPPTASSTHETRRHTFQSGAVYNGQWLGNERDGFGIMTWSDGTVYAGHWKNNSASGKGRFKHNDGDVYIGEWLRNAANGLGVYIHRDATKYEGQFLDDLQHGIGVETWRDQSQFQGQFKDGKKSGHGVYWWPDSSTYIGYWSGNQINGHGTYVGEDGRRFDGMWKSSGMNGCGCYKWPDGRKYEGQYKDDQKAGFGCFTWSDGRRYEGYWAGGRQHGLGQLIQTGGLKRLARWGEGDLLKWCDGEQFTGTSKQNYVMTVHREAYITRGLPFHDYLNTLMMDVVAEKKCSCNQGSLRVFDKSGAEVFAAPADEGWPLKINFDILLLQALAAANGRQTD